MTSLALIRRARLRRDGTGAGERQGRRAHRIQLRILAWLVRPGLSRRQEAVPCMTGTRPGQPGAADTRVR